MEVPLLSVSTISDLNNKVIANKIKVSVLWQLRNDIEWSFNIEAELLVIFSLLWFFWIYISIDHIPLLVNLTMLVPDLDVSVLSINASVNIHNLSFLVDDESTFKSEHLPPS